MDKLIDNTKKITKSDLERLQKAIYNFQNYEGLNSSNLLKAYHESFKGVEMILRGFIPAINSEKILYRVIQYDKEPDFISDCNFNPKAKQSRCNVDDNPVFYGTSHITSGVMESIIHSQSELDSYFVGKKHVGKKFIIGQWNLKSINIKFQSYIYSNPVSNAAMQRLQNKFSETFNSSISKYSDEEKLIIKEMATLTQSIFFGDDINLTSVLCYDSMYLKGIDAIMYFSAIKRLHAINYCLHPRIASDSTRLIPLRFNFCEIAPFPKGNFPDAILGYKVLKVGLPEIEENKICWLNDKDSMNRYRIDDGTPILKLY